MTDQPTPNSRSDLACRWALSLPGVVNSNGRMNKAAFAAAASARQAGAITNEDFFLVAAEYLRCASQPDYVEPEDNQKRYPGEDITRGFIDFLKDDHEFERFFDRAQHGIVGRHVGQVK